MGSASLLSLLRARWSFRGMERRSRNPMLLLDQRRWWCDKRSLASWLSLDAVAIWHLGAGAKQCAFAEPKITLVVSSSPSFSRSSQLRLLASYRHLFQPSALVCGTPHRAIRLRVIKYDPDISSSYGLHPGRDNHRVPLVPTPLTLSKVGTNAIFSRCHKTRPWHISNSSSYSTRKDFKPSNPTTSDPGHRATSTASTS